MMWTLDEGLIVARRLENVVSKYGLHVALGGGVMLRGESDHDLDLFLYPHKTSNAPERLAVLRTLEKEDFKLKEPNVTHNDYLPDAKFLGNFTVLQTKRVDVFYTS